MRYICSVTMPTNDDVKYVYSQQNKLLPKSPLYISASVNVLVTECVHSVVDSRHRVCPCRRTVQSAPSQYNHANVWLHYSIPEHVRYQVRVWLLFKFSFTFNHLIWVTIVFTDERGATLKQYDKHYLGRYRKDII